MTVVGRRVRAVDQDRRRGRRRAAAAPSSPAMHRRDPLFVSSTWAIRLPAAPSHMRDPGVEVVGSQGPIVGDRGRRRVGVGVGVAAASASASESRAGGGRRRRDGDARRRRSSDRAAEPARRRRSSADDDQARTGQGRARQAASDHDPARRRRRPARFARRPRPSPRGSVRARRVHQAVSNFVRARLTAARRAPAVVPSTAAGLLVGGALDGGHDQRGSFERGQVGHRGADVEPARPEGRDRAWLGCGGRRAAAAKRPEPVGREARVVTSSHGRTGRLQSSSAAVVPQAQVRVLGEVLGGRPVVRPGEGEAEDVGPVLLEGALVGDLGRFGDRHVGRHTYIHDAEGRNARTSRPAAKHRTGPRRRPVGVSPRLGPVTVRRADSSASTTSARVAASEPDVSIMRVAAGATRSSAPPGPRSAGRRRRRGAAADEPLALDRRIAGRPARPRRRVSARPAFDEPDRLDHDRLRARGRRAVDRRAGSAAGRRDGRSPRGRAAPPDPRTRSAPSAARSSDPSARRSSDPNRAMTASSAGSPGSTTSRATLSASMTTTPGRSPSQPATVDFPQPIGPVIPIRRVGPIDQWTARASWPECRART